jgi:hypothetical protein
LTLSEEVHCKPAVLMIAPICLPGLFAQVWALKPEPGNSQRWGDWILDGYAGAWFYATDRTF